MRSRQRFSNSGKPRSVHRVGLSHLKLEALWLGFFVTDWEAGSRHESVHELKIA